MYKEDLALNNPQWLICHKIKPINHQDGVFDFLYFKYFTTIIVHFSQTIQFFYHLFPVSNIYTGWGDPHGVMVKALDFGIVINEFKLQSCYYVHFQTNTFGKGMNPLMLPAKG